MKCGWNIKVIKLLYDLASSEITVMINCLVSMPENHLVRMHDTHDFEAIKTCFWQLGCARNSRQQKEYLNVTKLFCKCLVLLKITYILQLQ